MSAGYRLNRARLAEAAATAAAAKDHRARRIAERIVTDHGANLTVEDCDIRTWYRLWGKALQAATPGQVITAIGRECEKTGGRLLRASTFTTKLSQTCMCGAEVHKTLAERIHRCAACGSSPTATWSPVHWPRTSGSLTRTTPAPRAWTKSRPAPHRYFSHKGYKKPCRVNRSAVPAPLRGRTHAAARRPGTPRRWASARHNTTDRYRPAPNETRPANKRHKAHAGTAASVGNAPPSGATPEQELDGRHPITG
ncbi:hypothetical protein ACWERW_41155 [Streptomyces sp. NPDC004012]